MKILKIEFRNINSLKKEHEIDFTAPPFTGSSLFAITGPTGSGKSTILDVISLALFNQVPRLGKITKKEILEKGAILTKNQEEAFAKVTYECRSGKYASIWSISTNRNGNLRDHEMQVFDLGTGKALDLKKSEVPAKNEELIGLNYEQFIKAVVLAQGEFAQFLSARKDERGELLEKITGTGIYRQLGRMAFEKFREVNSDIQQEQQKIGIIRSKLLEEEQREAATRALAEKEGKCGPLQENIETLRGQLELKEQIAKRVREINALEDEKAQAQKQLIAFETEYGQPLKQHEQVMEFSEELRGWGRISGEIEELKQELGRKQEEEKKNLVEIQQCLEATGSFTKQEVSEGNISEKLEGFGKKVAQLQDARHQRGLEYTHLKNRLESTLSEVGFQMHSDPVQGLALLEQMRDSSQERLDTYRLQLQMDLDNTEKEKEDLREKLLKVRRAQQESGQLQKVSEELGRLGTEREKILQEKKDLPGQIESLGIKVANATQQLEILQLKKQNHLLRANLEELRGQLKEGEACPLCGSAEHPYAAHLPQEGDGLDREIGEFSEALKQLSHRHSTLTAQLQTLEQRLEEVDGSRARLEGEQKQRNVAFSASYGQLRDEGQSWEQQCGKLESQLLELEKCEKELRVHKAVSEGIPLHRQLNEVLQEGVKLKEHLAELYTGTDIHRDCQKLQNNWIRLSQQQGNLRKQQRELSEKLKQRWEAKVQMEDQLQKPLEEHGYPTISQALGALLPDRRFQELHGKREQVKQRLRSQDTSLELLGHQLKEFRSRETGKVREELMEELEAITAQLKELSGECEEYRRVLKNDAELQRELKTLQGGIAEKEIQIKRWRMLNDLIGDAQGKKFNDFAQDLTLAQLLKLANLRLKGLSDRYRIDKPRAEEDDGLVAIDDHMGGQRRSVKTLSGGETFILSLSMALALSDLASRNVEINSLFVDEGFGTLDPETLDQTLDTLEKLQAESAKTIGIISHVESLKERISTQVQLKRNGQGFSELVVAGR